MLTENLIKVFQFIDTYRERMVDDLKEAVAFKSISGSYEHKDDVHKMIVWTEKWLRKLKAAYERFDIGNYCVDGKTIKLPYVILATIEGGKGPKDALKLKTVCVYCRLDVKHANPSDWKTDPWILTEKNGLLYGRGTCKGKTPLISWLHCIEAYQGQKIPLPVNVKFIIEGMSEMNCFGLEDFLYTQRIQFLKNIDFICVNESEWINKTIPCISYGACGICRYDVICTGGGDGNGGGGGCGDIGEQYGYDAGNEGPNHELFDYIFKNIVDDTGNILIPHFNDNVVQITPEGERSLIDVQCDLGLLKQKLPKYMADWPKQRILLKLWRLPGVFIDKRPENVECTCGGDNDGAAGGGGDGGSGVRQKLILKIVPVQTPAECTTLLMNHIINLMHQKYEGVNHKVTTKFSNGGTKLTCKISRDDSEICQLLCTNVSATRPWKDDSVSPHYQAAKRAVKNVFKEPPNMIRESIDVPIILILQKIIRKSIILMPLGNNLMDENFANECVSMRNYFECKKMLAAYLLEVANIK